MISDRHTVNPVRQPPSALSARFAAAGFLLMLLVLMSLEIWHTYRQNEEDAQSEAAALSQLLSERLISGIRESSLILGNLDDNPQIAKLLRAGTIGAEDDDKLRRAIRQKLHGLDYLSRVDILDTGCQVIYSTHERTRLYQNRTDYCRWLHRKGADSDSSFTTVRHEQNGARIVTASRFTDEHDNVIGLAIGEMSPNFFRSEVGRVSAGHHGEILVTDVRHELISRWPALPRDIAGSPQPRQIFRREDNHLLYLGASPVDGAERIYSLRSSANYPLQVAVGISMEDFGVALRQKILVYSLSWLLLALLTLLALRSHLANLRQTDLLLASARKIKESEEQARLTLDTAPVALMLVNNLNQSILYANTPARHMLHLPEHFSAQTERDGAPLDLPLHLTPINDWLLTQETVRDKEVEIEREDKTRLWVMVSMQATRFRDQPATLIGLYDISERKALEQEIERKNEQLNLMAVTDPLTRLYNRRYADQSLKDEIIRSERYGQPLSVAIFDVDHFKQFNDMYGHQVGDNILIALSNELIDATRSTDVCARVGGEEFLVIFPCTRLKDAHTVMERVRTKMESTLFPFAQETVTFSGGMTGWCPGDTVATMQARADKLLYLAKVNGRNRLELDDQSL
ncbi:sensor domain-containing diguanylate cyclase [Paludibacterium paludis]|uniref:diguanylate cyclase n=1 Tax=Paludibacterium paludis TaxID=1225769 RepID=A0A918P6K1_9NEIS|nr:diguanylate cyclase [Paludibacterium paludis]GGY26554.1 diguanylate cyclase [Paludibacterium paludis]